MNNKDFVNSVATRCNLPTKAAARLTTALTDCMAEILSDETMLGIQGFGTFEVKKKLERIIVNPATHKRILVPPRLALTFKPGTTLKEKVK